MPHIENIYFLKVLILHLFCVFAVWDNYAQNANGYPAPATTTNYQSEYIWVSSTKLKFTFYTYRRFTQPYIFTANHFPDTCFLGIFVNNQRAISNIITIRDSIYSFPYNKCAGYGDCFTDQSCGGSILFWSIFRYSGIIDFSNSQIKDTLDKLNACKMDIVFNGMYMNTPPSAGNNNLVGSIGSNGDPQYCYFQINRCYSWKAGDKSPKPHLFHQPIWVNWREHGIQQIDFGYYPGSCDSISYSLTQPRQYPSGNFFGFQSGYSLSYYTESYCPGGSPCIAQPELNPPRGFYLNPKTGISKHYNSKKTNVIIYPPIFAIECNGFKKDSTGKQVHVSSQIRVMVTTPPNVVDTNKNKAAVIRNLAYNYTVCEEVTDTVTCRITDTMALNQTVADTSEFNWINTLNGANISITNLGAPLPIIKITWTPPEGSYRNNPHIFNLYSNDKYCSPDRRYVFRSAEYNTIPKPKFKVIIDTTFCSKLKFSASTTQSGPFKLDWLVFNQDDTIKISSKLQDSVNLPYPGKWYVRLKVQHVTYGCINIYLDSVLPINATIISSISKQKNRFCKKEIIVFTNTTINNIGPIKFQWFKNNLIVSDSSTYSLIADDTTNVRFIVSDKRNCTASDSVTITTFPEKVINHLPDTTFCKNASIDIEAVPVNLIDTITWHYNNSHNVKQTLSVSGSYVVKYNDSNACIAKDTFKLTQIETLLLSKLNDTSLCRNGTIKFALPLNPNINYDSIFWLKDGIKISQNYKPLISFESNSMIQLDVYGNQFNTQCTAGDTFNVIVFPESDINLVIASLDSCIKSNLFKANKTGTTATNSLKIDWGDFNSETFTGDINHSYNDTGNYKIRLFVNTINNCKDTASQYVHVVQSPKVRFTINDSDQCLSNNEFILNLNSIPFGGLKHKIDWDDNSFANNVLNGSISHIYSKETNSIKTFRINISISQGNACSDTMIKFIQIYPNPMLKIKAKGFCIGDSTHFIVTQLNTVPIQSLAWKISSIQVSILGSHSHLFNQIGAYQTVLKGLSNMQCEGSDTAIVDILEWPKAAFDFTRSEKDNFGIPFYFNDNSLNSTSWYWLINNSFRSTFKNLQYTFKDTGFARVKLLVSNRDECFDSIERIIPIVDKIQFFFPNAFSPNTNGINDDFGLNPNQHFLVKDYHLQIYNRWGEKVFETRDVTEHWQPDKYQPGVYLLKVEIRDIYNMFQEISGVVEVLR